MPCCMFALLGQSLGLGRLLSPTGVRRRAHMQHGEYQYPNGLAQKHCIERRISTVQGEQPSCAVAQ